MNELRNTVMQQTQQQKVFRLNTEINYCSILMAFLYIQKVQTAAKSTKKKFLWLSKGLIYILE